MKITVCEFPDQLDDDIWGQLVDHVRSHQSALVLLPEMPFHPWLMMSETVDDRQWEVSVQTHAQWLERIDDLYPATVIGTRPVTVSGKKQNEGFISEPERPYQVLHRKVYLPDEAGFWEASWYAAATPDFQVINTQVGVVGGLICTEMWFTQHAQDYARNGMQILAVPRATPLATAQKWLAGGQVAAVVSGAFCISSNRGGAGEVLDWGSNGWIIDPDGEILGTTSPEHPFLTLDVNLEKSTAARKTYPRYVYL